MTRFFTVTWARLNGFGLPNSIAIFVLNAKRMGRLFQFFGNLAVELLYSLHPELKVWIPRFISKVETYILKNPKAYAKDFLAIAGWIVKHGIWCTHKRELTAILWNPDEKCPILLEGLRSLFSSKDRLSGPNGALLLSVILAVFNISALNMAHVIESAARGTLNEPNAVTIESGFVNMISLNLVAINETQPNLIQNLSNNFAVAGIISSNLIGSNGGPSASSILDAHAIKSDQNMSIALDLLVSQVGHTPLKEQFESTASLPLVSGGTLLYNWICQILFVPIRGLVGSVKMNLWVASFMKPFSDVLLRLILLGPKVFVAISTPFGQDEWALNASRVHGGGVMSYNALRGGGMPIRVICLMLGELFGIDFSRSLMVLVSPTIIESEKEGVVRYTAVPNTLIKYVPYLSTIILSVHYFIINGLCIQKGISSELSFRIHADGSIVIINNELMLAVTTMYGDLGITISDLLIHNGEDDIEGSSIIFNDHIYVNGTLVSAFSPLIVNQFIGNGIFAWPMQVMVQKSGFGVTSEQFWNIVFPFMSKQDAKSLILINSLPTSITGLDTPWFPHGMEDMKGGAWYKAVNMTDTHIMGILSYLLIGTLLISLDSALNRFVNVNFSLTSLASINKATDFVVPGKDGKFDISDLPIWIPEASKHPLLVFLQNMISDVLSQCFLLASGTNVLTVGEIFQVFSLISLLDSQRENEVNSVWLMSYRVIINKLLVIVEGLSSGRIKEPLITTVKLNGFHHPYIVSWTKATGVRLTTVSMNNFNKIEGAGSKDNLLSKIDYFNPYAKK